MMTKIFAVVFLAALQLSAQTNELADTNAAAGTATNPPSILQRAEQIRAECLAGRRIICGKILKILPDGLVVESGYTDLLRPPLDSSWLVPGTVSASRPAGLIESREPESACVGVIFLTDIPRTRGSAKPKQYDYVVLLGYPAGQYTYTSVGTVHKTVRRFSANILKAVDLNFAASEKTGSAAETK